MGVDKLLHGDDELPQILDLALVILVSTDVLLILLFDLRLRT